MEENMEVMNQETSNEDVQAYEMSIEGPSKSFVAIVAGGIAAVAIGATVLIRKHKKKKAAKNQEADHEDAGFVEANDEAESSEEEN